MKRKWLHNYNHWMHCATLRGGRQPPCRLCYEAFDIAITFVIMILLDTTSSDIP